MVGEFRTFLNSLITTIPTFTELQNYPLLVIESFQNLNSFIAVNKFNSPTLLPQQVHTVFNYPSYLLTTEKTSQHATPFVYSSNEDNTLLSEMNFTDAIDSGRFTRFTNPMIEYEYRKGTYFTVWADRFPNLTLSIIELGRNEYFAKWFKSKSYKNLFNEDFTYYSRNFTPNTSSTSVSLSNN